MHSCCATVYAGQYRQRRVAVKEVIASTAHDMELLINEVTKAELLCNTAHPNIVRIYGTVRDLGRCACHCAALSSTICNPMVPTHIPRCVPLSPVSTE